MAMLMADVSSWQPDSDSWFRKLADLGVKAVVVKLTEGTTYQNPKAAAQLAAGRRMGMQVHAYHYAHFHNSAEAVAEGRFFGVTARALGVSTQSVMAADVEAPDLNGELTGLTNVFIQTVKALGYPHTDLYTMANWMKTRRFDRVALIPKNLWIASYGVDQPGINNVGTWQFTNNFHGLGVDMSYDFFGHYTTRLTGNLNGGASTGAMMLTFTGTKVQDHAYVIMMTSGNYRKMVTAWFNLLRGKGNHRQTKRRALNYSIVVGSFVAGAVITGILTHLVGDYAIWCVTLVLLAIMVVYTTLIKAYHLEDSNI